MAKTIEQMFDEKQKGIKESLKRRSKTEISIGFRWSVNTAISFLPEHLKGTIKGFKQLKKWQPRFEDWDREFMLDHIQIEPAPKLTRQDFAEAKAEAPASQTEQDSADALKEEEIKEEEFRKANELSDLAVNEEMDTSPEEEVQSPKDAPAGYPE